MISKRSPVSTIGAVALSGVAFFCLSEAASACPDYSMWGNEVYNMSGAELYSPESFFVTAGGDSYVDVTRERFVSKGGWSATCTVWPETDQGTGYFISQPDFTFDLWGLEPYELDIRVDSACDAVLLVSTATGQWIYDDDDNGNLDPRIHLTHPANGLLDVWVGTLDGIYCDATLTLETNYK